MVGCELGNRLLRLKLFTLLLSILYMALSAFRGGTGAWMDCSCDFNIGSAFWSDVLGGMVWESEFGAEGYRWE